MAIGESDDSFQLSFLLFKVKNYNQMLRKKNYKEEDHFNQYYSVNVVRNNGRKCIVYYKRYRPKVSVEGSLYQNVQNGGEKKKVEGEYPMDRTLEVLSFDGDL